MVSNFFTVPICRDSGRLCCWADGTGWFLGYGCCFPSELCTPRVEGKKHVESITDSLIEAIDSSQCMVKSKDKVT